MENNNIEYRGGMAMVEALRASRSLNYLNLLSNAVEKDCRVALKKVAQEKKGTAVDLKV